jgi:predicted HicB family RNase H-like nuclease
MAIAKKPKSNLTATTTKESERAAESFISGAGKQAAPAEDTGKKTPFMVRFDADVLKRVDEAAKRRGISRSAWIQFTVSRALDQGEG